MTGKQVYWNRSLAVGLTLVVSTSAMASMIKIQPDEAESDDVLTYQLAVADAGFDIPGVPAVTNLDDDNLSLLDPPSAIGTLLGTALTNAVDHADFNGGIPIFTGNSAHTWIRFNNLPAADASNVVSASLNLFALDGKMLTGAFDNPSVEKPVTTRVFDAGSDWNEQIITWNNENLPGDFITEVEQTEVNAWVSFDVTGIVQDWLSGAKDNNGLFLDQKDVVFSDEDLSGIEDLAASLYPSSAFGDETLRPFLEIQLVPEPTSAMLMAMAGVLLFARRK